MQAHTQSPPPCEFYLFWLSNSFPGWYGTTVLCSLRGPGLNPALWFYAWSLYVLSVHLWVLPRYSNFPLLSKNIDTGRNLSYGEVSPLGLRVCVCTRLCVLYVYFFLCPLPTAHRICDPASDTNADMNKWWMVGSVSLDFLSCFIGCTSFLAPHLSSIGNQQTLM